ncbi:WhiB family redox-sensing transcriptional regulator [Streptomonospora nanhaiensis]|uniref:WhiB family redox-sensing transcriptional regulator n=1 Tax=Streptomonospora nanhaiensis TaxID=1323731 RepID=A0A853BMI7_9ACTN|nr:WhiB family transcriptional regulator [Streptomonospora nanhaiensis]NYI95904.1 WhiB family redox-sensing transcriptional regulator [Streptomonospora nanhaiensis]
MTSSLDLTPSAAPSWMGSALCAQIPTEQDLWFPEPERGPVIAWAKRVCARCPVRSECLEAALALSGPDAPRGVWGGTTAHERERIRSRRRAARRGQAA